MSQQLEKKQPENPSGPGALRLPREKTTFFTYCKVGMAESVEFCLAVTFGWIASKRSSLFVVGWALKEEAKNWEAADFILRGSTKTSSL